MANLCKIYLNDTEYINLTAYPYHVSDMTSNAPDTRTARDAFSFAHGEVVLYARYSNVTEEYTIIVAGATNDEVNTNLDKLEISIREVIAAINDYGDKVWIYSQPDGVALTYRSPILSASVVGVESRLHEASDFLLASATYPHAKYTIVKLVFERAYYWESTVETNLPLSSTDGGTDVTTGLQCCNIDTGATSGPVNNINIKAAHVLYGSLPSPARIRILSTVAATEMNRVIISHNAYGTPSDLTYWYEAEDGTRHAGVTKVAAAGTSNDYRAEINHNDSTEHTDITIILTGAQLKKWNGRWCKIFLLLSGTPHPAYMRVQLSQGSVNYYTSDWIIPDLHGYTDMATIMLPPGPAGGFEPDPVDLNIQTKCYGLTEIYVDAVILLPCGETDGYCELSTSYYAPSTYDHVVVIDGPQEMCYTINSDLNTGAYPNLVLVGPYPMIVPNKAQRFVITTYGTYEHYYTVWIGYRERRLKI